MKYLKLFEKVSRRKFIEDFYKWRCETDDINDADIVGWRNKDSQNKRFNVFLTYIKSNNSILDYGCGVGDLYGYLNGRVGFMKSKRRKDIKYKGVDIQQKMVDKAKIKYPNGDFSIVNRIKNVRSNFDWVVASGVFTVGMNHINVLDYFESGYKICNKGIMANFLESDFDSEKIVQYKRQNKDGHTLRYTYYNLDLLKKFLEEKLGKKFILINNYSTEDFTLILLK